jgi:outer membrane receptor protein involved in Fe transport
MLKLILLAFSFALPIWLNAQIKGVVFGTDGTNKEPIYGAQLKLLSNRRSVSTDSEGRFELILPKELPDTLVVSAMGYSNDTVIVTLEDRFISLHIILISNRVLPEVRLTFRKGTHGISKLKTLHIEELTSGELRKAACCNLSESFETNASVDVNITDAVSGAKKIQLMGLDGVYTQIQMENIPYLRGLESSFGMNSIPGTWIESIQITKGTGNVVNGFESMAGLINLELKKPQEMERFFANGYVNAFGRAELNMHAGHKFNDKWSTGWLAHTSGMFGEVDNNGDGFRDMPMGNLLSFMNRWAMQGEHMEAQFGINAYRDQKTGGQLGYHHGESSNLYGVYMESKHIDLFAKTGFFLKKQSNSIGVVYNLKYQTLDAHFGTRPFSGVEKRGYVNAIYDGTLKNADHKIKFGASIVYTDIDQRADTINADRTEWIPGVFAEYSYVGARLSLVGGARYDVHNLFGAQFSPRLHLKYTLHEFTDIRATIGKGWRVPNYLIDNVSLLASSKPWVAVSSLLPEVSWNTGVSWVQELKLFNRKSSLVVDYYFTRFTNQLLVDRDANLDAVVFKNLNGASFSHSTQAEWSVEPLKNLEVRFAYKYLDVRATYGGLLQQQVMIPTQRGLIHFGYISRNKRWEYNLTTSIYGRSRLPGENQFSTPYPIMNAQVLYIVKRWEWYLGGENLTNFKQRNAIIDPQNPFGAAFDATEIWGPVMGINGYVGVRYAIKKK